MYRLIRDFSQAWETETAATRRILSALTDASLAQPVTPNGRTLGRLAWHLVEALVEMPSAAGLPVDPGCGSVGPPATASGIAACYGEVAAELDRVVRERWSDADLATEIDMYGQRWTKGVVLQVLLMHQAHHRGQMTVLMRQAGLGVPGVCGPSAEEWVAMGMLPQE